MARITDYKGLTSEEAAKSREVHGANTYARAKNKSIFKRLLENLNDPIIRILLIAMVINLIFTIKNINWAENIGMIAAIIISTVVSAISERGSEQAFEKIREEEQKFSVQTMRDGKIVTLKNEEIVVNDLVFLEAGGRIPADCRILDGSLKIDESAINGESKPATKNKNAEIYAGCMIVEGEGSAIVTDVGDKSIYGQIAKEIQTNQEDSPLKKRLSNLAKMITKIGYAAAIIVAFSYLFNIFAADAGYNKAEIIARLTNPRFVAMHVIKAVTIAMTVIVVAVPEGLPMMISVVLSANIKKMLRDKVLVRKPVGIETAGCMNILFTDKTGTLTYGKPVCTEFVFGDGERYNGKNKIDNYLTKLLNASVSLNTSCKYTDGKIVGGNATDQAIFAFAGIENAEGTVVEKIPFDSKRKYALSRVELQNKRITLIKGAPEIIVAKCTKYINSNGIIQKFDNIKMQRLTEKLQRNGARILALCYHDSATKEELPENMIFLCIAVLNDGLRDSAGESVDFLKKAGVHVVMITGDSKETAMKIAKDCGIMNEEKNIVIEGKELSERTDNWIKDNMERIAVICRALPNDKNRLVRLSKEKGLVVGMTGDGINDAPALKNADVGFSMGQGNDVAKEASDIIILDNDLRSIVKAVLYGRTIFKSIRKFITFQLIMNICAVGVTLIGQFIGIEHPITVIQMLWVNMIMDTLGGLAFAGEQPMNCYLKEKPITRNEPILTSKMLRQIVIMGGYGTAMCSTFLSNKMLKILFLYPIDNTPFLTAFFALFIFTGLAICFTARSERINLLSGLLKNKSFLIIMILITIIQMLMLYFGGETFRCVGLNMKKLIPVIILAMTVLPIDFLRRITEKAALRIRVQVKKKEKTVELKI